MRIAPLAAILLFCAASRLWAQSESVKTQHIGTWISNGDLSIKVSNPVIDTLNPEKAAEVRAQFGVTKVIFDADTMTIIKTDGSAATRKYPYKVVRSELYETQVKWASEQPGRPPNVATLHFIGESRYCMILVKGMMEFFDRDNETK